MKLWTIAFKVLKRSLRSAFALVFMFGIPLVVTGMFFLMFGSGSDESAAGQAAATRVALADLDGGASGGARLGAGLAASLQDEGLADLLAVTTYADAAGARQAVDDGQADVAVIIPPDFSAQYGQAGGEAIVQLYQPAGGSAATVVQAVLGPALDSLAGAKIAMQVAGADAAGPAPDPTALLEVRAPGGSPADSSILAIIIGPIMGGMMIFFAFFTACSTGQSILQEDEAGTLPRLFTTPTRQAVILGGKFLAVGLTVLVQVSVLLLVSHLIFHIQWGSFGAVALTALGIVVCATSFGILLNSLLRSTRQAGAVFGGLLTITGMVAMMSIFTGDLSGAAGGVSLVSLLMPQGWAVRGLLLGMAGAPLNEVLLNLGALLAIGLVCFGVGVLRFQKRFA